MVFSSIPFLYYFMPVFFLGYLLCRGNNVFLLGASLLFYGWGAGGYVFLLLFAILVNWGWGLFVAQERLVVRRGALFLGVSGNLLLLIFFKYAKLLAIYQPFLSQRLAELGLDCGRISPPLGISFFTFQAISYLVDVYRREARVERNPLAVAVYLSMFPQLLAGPIVRYCEIAGQIHRRRHSMENCARGVQIFTIGLGQKVLLATTLAIPVEQIFALPGPMLTAPVAWLGAVSYTLQIYYDFAGYSNMALGLGLLLGFRLPENFRFPYASQSVGEFWRRWHMTLSRWFKEYLYIPLGGNRHGRWRTYSNLWLVFLLCGVWHGANLTFLVWGVYYGFFMVLERSGGLRVVDGLWQPFRHLYTMLVVVVGWVIFRSESIKQVANYLGAMFGLGSGVNHVYPLVMFLPADVWLALLFGTLFSMPWVAGAWYEGAVIHPGQPVRDLRWSEGVSQVFVLVAILVLVAMNLSAGSYNPFIYFRF